MFFYSEEIGPTDSYFANVSLLLKGNGTNDSTSITDSSLNKFTITAQGNSKISTSQSKFGDSSLYFDGDGDFLNIADAYNIVTTGSFTMEAWVYKTTGSAGAIVGTFNWNTGNNCGWLMLIGSDNKLYLTTTGGWNGTSTIISSSTTISLNSWNHVAITRDSSDTIRCFINGELAGTVTNYSYNLNLESTNPAVGNKPLIRQLKVGAYVADNTIISLPYKGYIDNIRITTGVARYTDSFTPPDDFYSEENTPVESGTGNTPTDPYAANVSLLLKGDGTNNSTNIVDSSANNLTITRYGDTKISTDQSKFGGSSIYFDGTLDYLDLGNIPFRFRTEDFTIEFWINCLNNDYLSVGVANSYPHVLSTSIYNANNGIIIYIDGPNTGFNYGGTTGVIHFQVVGRSQLVSTSIIRNAGWKHIAITRNGSSFKLFVNGILENSFTDAGVDCTGNSGFLCAPTETNGAANTSYGLNEHMYLDDFRVTKGVARYTANFTPPGAL